MLDRVFVRSHATFGSQPLDVGALAEACLFYGSTDLVFVRGTLHQLLEMYGADQVVEFVSGGYVRAHLLDLDSAVMTEDTNGPSERHRPITFRIDDGTLEAQVVEAFRMATGKSRLGRRRARAFLDVVRPLDLPAS